MLTVIDIMCVPVNSRLILECCFSLICLLIQQSLKNTNPLLRSAYQVIQQSKALPHTTSLPKLCHGYYPTPQCVSLSLQNLKRSQADSELYSLLTHILCLCGYQCCNRAGQLGVWHFIIFFRVTFHFSTSYILIEHIPVDWLTLGTWEGGCAQCVHMGERSYAPECADKLVKWGVVPGGTLTLSAVVFLPSHIIILLISLHFRVHAALMQYRVYISIQSFYFTFLSSFVSDAMLSIGN